MPLTRGEHRSARVGSGARPPLVSLAVGRAARARAPIAHGAVSRRHPHRARDAPIAPGARASRCSGRVAGARRARRLLAAVGHGGGGRHLVRAGVAAPAAHARPRAAAAGVAVRAAAAPDRARGRSARSRAAGRDSIGALRAIADVWWCAATLVVEAADPHSRSAARTDGGRLLADRRDRGRWCRCSRSLLLPRRARRVAAARARHLRHRCCCSPTSSTTASSATCCRRRRCSRARQTGHVWGSIGSLFTPRLLWLVLDLPFALLAGGAR